MAIVLVFSLPVARSELFRALVLALSRGGGLFGASALLSGLSFLRHRGSLAPRRRTTRGQHCAFK